MFPPTKSDRNPKSLWKFFHKLLVVLFWMPFTILLSGCLLPLPGVVFEHREKFNRQRGSST